MVNVSTAVPAYVAAGCRVVLEANRMGTLAAVRAAALADTHDRAAIYWCQVNWIARELVSR